jgi:SAM-dependent methyltransferase
MIRKIFKVNQTKVKQAGSIENYYRELFQKFGDSHETVRYSSKKSQFKRYHTLVKIGDLTGSKVLDFGCGVGHFLEFLSTQNLNIEKYIGIEIVPEMLAFARNKYPSASFFLPSELNKLSFDYGFVSGTFNDKVKNNRKFWQDTIARLFSRCEKGIAFNMMSTYVNFQNKDLFYESPEYVFQFVKNNLTPYVTLCHDFETKENSVPFEFVIYAYKYPNQGN